MGAKLYRQVLYAVSVTALFLGAAINAAVLEISPTNQTIISGQTAQFSAQIVGTAALPFSFSWSDQGFFYSTNQTINVTNAGKYSVTATDADGQAFGAVCATLYVKIPPTVTVTTNATLTCLQPQVTLYAKSTALSPIYNWTGPGIVSGATSSNAVVNMAGTYTVTLTSSNGCTASASAEVSEGDRTPPSLTVETPETLTCTKTSVVLRASSTTNVFFQWYGPGIVTGRYSATCTVNQPGVYTVTATSLMFSSYGMQSTGTIYLNTNRFYGFDTNSLIYTNLFGSVYGSIDYSDPLIYPLSPYPFGSGYPITYPAIDSCPDVPYGGTIDQNGTTNLVIPFQYLVGAIAGPIIINGGYEFHYDSSISNTSPTGNGCSSTAMVVVELATDHATNSSAQDLHREFVTFGQAFWSSPTQKINGHAVKDVRKNLLLNPTNLTSSPLVLGKPGRSLMITTNSAPWLNRRLPAIGAPQSLPEMSAETLSRTNGQLVAPHLLTQDGHFQSRLLGDTIALGLSLRMDPELSEFVLSSSFCTQKALPGADHLIGTEDDRLDLLGLDNVRNSGDEIQHFTISPIIFDALCSGHLPNTVEGLFELSNRALAGQSTANASVTDISEAVQTILRAFHGGRFCVPCE